MYNKEMKLVDDIDVWASFMDEAIYIFTPETLVEDICLDVPKEVLAWLPKTVGEWNFSFAKHVNEELKIFIKKNEDKFEVSTRKFLGWTLWKSVTVGNYTCWL